MSATLSKRKIAFVCYPLEDPAVLMIVEIVVPQIGHNLLEGRAVPEEIFLEPEGLVNLKAEGDKGHAFLCASKIFTSFAFEDQPGQLSLQEIMICP
ncbi:MAG: hypothetical protein CG440_87 [Methanosaeta sp. NSM2]|nr:MAG: hypothetical protein CG440_87 [Methanosaeta sp. NSM2]